MEAAGTVEITLVHGVVGETGESRTLHPWACTRTRRGLPFGGDSGTLCDVAELQGRERDHAQREPDHGQISCGPPERRTLFQQRSRTDQVALKERHGAETHERLGSESGWRITAGRQRALQILLPLAEVAALHPEPAQRRCELQTLFATFGRRQAPVQCQPQVVVLSLQSIEPGDLPLSGQLGLGALNQLVKKSEMAVPQAFGFA